MERTGDQKLTSLSLKACITSCGPAFCPYVLFSCLVMWTDFLDYVHASDSVMWLDICVAYTSG
jgi:hypothetical protein